MRFEFFFFILSISAFRHADVIEESKHLSNKRFSWFAVEEAEWQLLFAKDDILKYIWT